MKKRIRELEAQIADVMIKFKQYEQMANFYKQQLRDALAEEGNDIAEYTSPDGTKVSLEYVGPTQSKSFNQAYAKEKLKEAYGEDYVETDYYKVSNKEAYVKLSVDFSNSAFE